MQTLKHILITTALCFPLCVFSQLSTNGGTLTVNGSESGGNYFQRDEVDIVPGTSDVHITPSDSAESHLYLDPNIIIPITSGGGYQTANGSSSSGGTFPEHHLDLSFPVGAIKGSPSVSPYGQSSYSIPITLPPGTNRMVPSLSINYNSGSYAEAVGLGWSIGGISVISRVPKDVLHDGITQGVQIDQYDALEFNGVRMLAVDSSGKFGLESDDFTRIKHYTSTGNFDNYFLAEMKDGTKMELGNSVHSKLSLNYYNQTPDITYSYSYYVNKVYDNYGNFITYIYDVSSSSNNEIYLKEIQYTGNQDPTSGSVRTQPYNSIKFYYTTKSNNLAKRMGGNSLPSTLLLREIEVFCDGVSAKKYDFNYAFDNKYDLLNEIIETGSDDSKLNSTLIAYGTGVANSITTVDPVTDTSGTPLPSSADLRVGDFNADGLADILAFPFASVDGLEVQANGIRFYTGWQLFINQDGGNTFKMTDSYTSLPNDPKISPFKSATYQSPFYPNQPNQMIDFNQDGKLDMFIQVDNGGLNNDAYRAYLSNGITFTQIPYNNQVNIGGSINSFGVPAFSQIAIGDFDGNKTMEGFAFCTAGTGFSTNPPTLTYFRYDTVSTKKIIVYDVEPSIFSITSIGGNNLLSDYSGFSALDFDGDGVSELLGIRSGYYVVLKCSDFKLNSYGYSPNFGVKLTEIYKSELPVYSFGHFLPGDYNGDGIADVFALFQSAAKLSLGTGVDMTSFNPIANIPSYWQNMHINHLALDANGDGITDIVDLESNGANIDVNVNFPNSDSSFNRVSYGSVTGKTFPLVKDFSEQSLFYANHSLDIAVNSNMNTGPDVTNTTTGDWEGPGGGTGEWYGESGGQGHSPTNSEPVICSPGFQCDDQYPPLAKDNPEFETGDFNGDGHDDIILRTYDLYNNRTIIFIDPDNKENLVTHILDGYSNEVVFDYKSIATAGSSSIYKKDTGATFPVYDFQNPMYVVSSLSVPDGIGGTSVNTYTYSGAKFDCQVYGRGFTGFNQFSATNSSTLFQTVNTYSLNVKHAVRLPLTSTKYLSSTHQQLSQTLYTPSISELGNERFFTKTDNVSETDNVTGATNVTDYYYDGNTLQGASAVITDGNITKTVENNSSIETITTTNTYQAGAWLTLTPALNSKLKNCSTSVVRGSQPAYTRQVDYGYDAVTGQVLTITKDIGKDNSVVTTNTYDSNTGVLLQSDITAPNTVYPSSLPVKSTVLVYDPEFRLPIKQTDPELRVTELTYNYVFGVPLTVKNIDGLTSAASYDGYGRITKIISPDNLETTVSINWYQPGHVVIPGDPHPISENDNTLFYTQITKPGSPSSVTLYDNIGRVIKNQKDGFNNQISNVTTYDAKGQVATQIADYIVPGTDDNNNILTTTNDYNSLMQLHTQTVTNDNGLSLLTTVDYAYDGTGTTTVTITPPDDQHPKTYTRVTDPTGLLTYATDNAGKLVYDYYSNRNIKSVVLGGSQISVMEYDAYGMQSKLAEVNSGITTYTYNAYGQLYAQTDSKAQTSTYTYDKLDRLTQELAPGGGTYTYQYVPGGAAGAGQIQLITAPLSITSAYTYDQLSRLSQMEETVDGNPYITTFQYDNYSNVVKKIYPGSDNFALLYEYNNIGYPTKIKRADNGNNIWQATEINQFGQYTKYNLGNGIQTTKTYDIFGMPKTFVAGSVQNLSFNFDQTNGNLNSISDNLKSITEYYLYDHIDRLTDWWLGDLAHNTIGYNDVNGNISQKSDIGNYSYSNAKLNAAIKVDNANGIISPNTQTIDYTYFNKTQTVKEVDTTSSKNLLNQLDITYGSDKERIKAEARNSAGTLVSTKYYLSDFEKEVLPAPTNATREVNYINSPDGLCAMYVNDNGTKKLYYVYSDQLGSLNTLTNEQGSITAQQNFDPWGRPRNPNTWDFTADTTALPAWLTRGYTGHEHLPKFNLINMNGRMYDPIIARMLSADNQVTDPTSTQSHNRYSYVNNNPLKFTDPSGYSAASVNTGGDISLSSGTGDFSATSPGYGMHSSGLNQEQLQERQEERSHHASNPITTTTSRRVSDATQSYWNTRFFAEYDSYHFETTTHTGSSMGQFSSMASASTFTGTPGAKNSTTVPVGIFGAGAIRVLEEILAKAAVFTIPLTFAGDQDIHNKSSETVYYHYTNSQNMGSIVQSSKILPNSKGKVYITPAVLGPADVFQRLFLGQGTHSGKQYYYIKFAIRKADEAQLQFHSSQPSELVYPNGTLRIRIIDYGYNSFGK